MKICIDFETLDYGIREGLGPGWAWGACKVLGCGIKIDDGPAYYETNVEEIINICIAADVIVAHNAQYEAGVLAMLGVNIKQKVFYCTQLGAKLYNNVLYDYSLDGLGKRFLNETKSTNKLIEVGGEIGIFTIPDNYSDPSTYMGGDARVMKRLKTAKNRMMNLVWENLDRIQEASSVVADYCIQDVELTYKLHQMWMEQVGEKTYQYYCKLINVATAMKAKGVRVDIKKTYDVKFKLEGMLRPLERQLWEKFGHFNYNSPAQVKLWAYNQLNIRGIKDDEGKESFGKEWVEANADNEDVAIFARIKKLDKLISFTQTIINHEKHGRVHPQLNIMQARTGRFSCVNPNIQQIPARDELAPLIRGLFLPEEGEDWYSLDFSSQEPRLQVHYAEAIGSANGKELADKYRSNKRTDLYVEACAMVKEKTGIDITRKDSKIMTLALSYGMGKEKGAKALGVAVKKYQEVRNAYFKGASYLKELNNFCQERIRQKGFLVTIGGRKTHNQSGYEYKALNSLIQGGAFDQTAAALIKAYYEKDIIPLNTVHDEINISSSERKVAEDLQEIMENCIIMNIPSVADIGVGGTWADAKV